VEMLLVETTKAVGRSGADAAAVTLAEHLAAAVGARAPIRFDLAWALLQPDALSSEGADIPSGNPRTRMRLLLDWSRQALGQAATVSRFPCAVGLLPRLAPAAAQWVRQIVSFYADTVGICRLDHDDLHDPEEAAERLAADWKAYREGSSSRWTDAWTAPIARPWAADPGPLLRKTKKTTPSGTFVYLGALLGSDRLAVQTYRLGPGGRGNRRHGHSDVDECYLVLEGGGKLDLGTRFVPLAAGDVVAKPAGSRLAFAFVAGPEGMTILDVEGWRDFHQTDVVTYPDHREWYLRGPALEVAVAEDALLPADEVLAHYDDVYVRRLDGRRDPVGTEDEDY